MVAETGEELQIVSTHLLFGYFGSKFWIAFQEVPFISSWSSQNCLIIYISDPNLQNLGINGK